MFVGYRSSMMYLVPSCSTCLCVMRMITYSRRGCCCLKYRGLNQYHDLEVAWSMLMDFWLINTQQGLSYKVFMEDHFLKVCPPLFSVYHKYWFRLIPQIYSILSFILSVSAKQLLFSLRFMVAVRAEIIK